MSSSTTADDMAATTPSEPIECGECRAVFRTVEQMSRHKAVHTDPMPFGCDVCPAKFKRFQELPQHVLYNHSNSGIDLACKQCDEKFASIKVCPKLLEKELTQRAASSRACSMP
ncbi:hypothetical protein HDU84_009483 [Entophlyctis sp. JEL0112]|nr:hypothetical protein HDU84_009483 [Entophlyctis sp. JEL0112]